MAVYYNLTDLPQPGNIVAFWQMEESSGQLLDQTTNNHDLTYNGVLYAQSGIITNGLGLDGTDDYGYTSDSNDWYFGTGNFTLSVWVKFTNASNMNGRFFNQNVAGYANFWSIDSFSSEGRIDIAFYWAGTYVAYYTMPFAPSVNTWYHVIVGRNGTSAFGMINGEVQSLKKYISFGVQDVRNVEANLVIGKREDDGYNPVEGIIDEPIIWKGVALDVEEQIDLYSGGAPQRSGGVSYVPRQSGSCGLHIF